MRSSLPEPWRHKLPTHPAAELFPLLSEQELCELAADIEQHGQQHPITVLKTATENKLLDGRNRLDALEYVHIPIFDDSANLISMEQPDVSPVFAYPGDQVRWSRQR